MDNPIISIVVPVYNVEKYLSRCVDSILEQTFEAFELILVNDGSKDTCASICDAYKMKDPRVRVIHKENGGLSDARNVGIKASKGLYIGFVDSDDYIAKDMYAKLYELIEKYSADISVCDAVLVSDLENAQFSDSEEIKVLNSKQAVKAMIYDKTISVNAWNKLYKKELFKSINYPRGMLYEDLDTTYKLFDISNVIVTTNAKKYAYVQRRGSIMNLTGYYMHVDKVKILSNMLRYFEEKKSNYDYEQIFAGIILYLMNDIYKMATTRNLSKNLEYLDGLNILYQGQKANIKKNKFICYKDKWILRLAVKNTRLVEWLYADLRKILKSNR